MADYPPRIALERGIEGVNTNAHSWAQEDELEKIYDKYDHPLYKRMNALAKDSGHGGMDGILDFRIIECLQQGLPLDQNVYEGCLWSAVTPLSESSVAQGGMPQKFPDFTRGSWQQTQPLTIVS